MCPFAVRVPVRWSLAGFLGSMITLAVALHGWIAYCQVPLGRWICLPTSTGTPFNGLFRQAAEVSLLRHRVTRTASNVILNVSSIGMAFRRSLRSRLTPGRLTLPGKPESFGEGASHPLSRYLYLHLLFHALQQASPAHIQRTWNAPLPILSVSHSFGNGFHTRLLSTRSPSTSELLRTL